MARVLLPKSRLRKSKQKLVKIRMVENGRNVSVEIGRRLKVEHPGYLERCRQRWIRDFSCFPRIVAGLVKSEPKQKWKYKRCSLILSQFPIVMTDYLNHSRRRIRIALAVAAKKRLRIAVAAYLKRARRFNEFNAIAPPKRLAGQIEGDVYPVSLKKDGLRPLLTTLSILALDEYNSCNQDSKFVFDNLVKATFHPCNGRMYFITFKAKAVQLDAAQLDAFNTPATIFQAKVWDRADGELSQVKFCAIKT